VVGRKGRVEYLAFQAPGQGTGIRYRGENPEALKRANLRCGGEGFGGKGGGGAASGVDCRQSDGVRTVQRSVITVIWVWAKQQLRDGDREGISLCRPP